MTSNNEETITAHVASRIRSRRMECGKTQQQVAGLLGISFQQLQKYEHGTNRITAGRLYQLAEVLDTNIAYFFADYETGATKQGQSQEGQIDAAESMRLVRQFNAIPSGNIKRSVLGLIRSLEKVENE
ncbi:helix-turn-helix domain-containing protein [Pelagibius sp. Alg239-R121]|uniref:helix-turn-helix domain-containing protein n=1 Tax=Pelagibius sp. Alg239-R121 TaxID=2993448 RepID=UPI0024A68B74|nr:helix-turn-helix domain-containing protein [Pelagibius sp. Alg239-R121]